MFDSLKYTLTHAPLLHPPYYTHEFSLYLATSHATISMVLVKELETYKEHVIYYLSRSLTPCETRHSHVEKMAFVPVKVVQRFHHYIILCKTIIIYDSNPMYHILTRQTLGGKYSH